jgi:DNA-binding transcriptional MerR regulator
MKVKELKAALKELGLSVKGKKAVLEARLAEAQLPEEEEAIEDEVVEEVAQEELEEEVEEVIEEVEEEVVTLEVEEEPMDEVKPVHNPLTNILRFNPHTGEREPMQVKKLDIQEHINGDYGMGDIILPEAEEK